MCWSQLHFFPSVKECVPAAVGTARLEQVAEDLAFKRPWTRDVEVPDFWPSGADRTSRQLIFVGRRHMWASKSFSWQLFGCQKQTVPGKPQLERAVKKMMPGYDRVVAPRWSIDETVKECCNDVDLAWLTMTWRYSAIMPAEEYPCGLRVWPPP